MTARRLETPLGLHAKVGIGEYTIAQVEVSEDGRLWRLFADDRATGAYACQGVTLEVTRQPWGLDARIVTYVRGDGVRCWPRDTQETLEALLTCVSDRRRHEATDAVCMLHGVLRAALEEVQS